MPGARGRRRAALVMLPEARTMLRVLWLINKSLEVATEWLARRHDGRRAKSRVNHVFTQSGHDLDQLGSEGRRHAAAAGEAHHD